MSILRRVMGQEGHGPVEFSFSNVGERKTYV